MQFNRSGFTKMLLLAVITVSVPALGGCASKMVEVRPGSDRVSLADTDPNLIIVTAMNIGD
jgi:hypothetical protein